MTGDNQDIEQKVIIDYSTNAEDTAKSIDKLDNSMDSVQDTQKASIKTQKTAKKAQDATTKSTKNQKAGLEDLGGGIGGAIKGFKGLLKQMWLIVANPVGLVIAAIVGGLALLFKAFTSTKAGAEKFEQVMDGISATIDVLRDRVLKIGEAYVKFFSWDFAGAIDTAKEAVDGFGEEVAREFEIAANARKSLQEVADAMRDLGVTRAKLNRDLIEAKEIIEGSTATYKEKQDAIEQVRKAETAQTEAELANAKKKLKAIQDQNKQSDSGADALQAEADAKIAVFNLERISSENKIKFNKLELKADNEESTRKKAIAAQAVAIEKQKEADFQAYLKRDEVRKEKEKEEAVKKQAEADQRAQDLIDLQEYEDAQELIITEAEDKRLENLQKKAAEELAIEEALLAQKKAVESAKMGLLSDGLNALKNIFSENKKVQKGILIAENAAALAKVTMNTIEAVSKDNAASPLTLGMPWSGIHLASGAIGAANIIASTATGLKALGGGSAGSAPSFGTASSSSATPSVDFQSSSENQIATTIADNTNEAAPTEVFVVSKTVTTAQELDRNKIDSNSIG